MFPSIKYEACTGLKKSRKTHRNFMTRNICPQKADNFRVHLAEQQKKEEKKKEKKNQI